MDTSEYDNITDKTTPIRGEISGSFSGRRKKSAASRGRMELNSTALHGSLIEKMPVYSPCQSTDHVKNPFEQAWLLKERLSRPICSPGMFQKVISPINKSGPFTWSIDDISELRPAQIDENPSQDFASWFSPDTESQAQEAIDRFFHSNAHGTLESPVIKTKCNTSDTACQTEISMPANLSLALEEELMALMRRIAKISNNDEMQDSFNCSARRKILTLNTDHSSDEDNSVKDESMDAMFAATPLRARSMSPDLSPIVGGNCNNSDWTMNSINESSSR